jgi:hypothetical protein
MSGNAPIVVMAVLVMAAIITAARRSGRGQVRLKLRQE